MTKEPKAILLVDDETSVRTMVSRVLSKAGFTVYEASCAREALTLLRQGRTIHLMVTDIVMPEMNGYELSREVRKALPALPVIFISGYADETMLKAASAQENSTVLMKPFSPTELLRRIRALKPT